MAITVQYRAECQWMYRSNNYLFSSPRHSDLTFPTPCLTCSTHCTSHSLSFMSHSQRSIFINLHPLVQRQAKPPGLSKDRMIRQRFANLTLPAFHHWAKIINGHGMACHTIPCTLPMNRCSPCKRNHCITHGTYVASLIHIPSYRVSLFHSSPPLFIFFSLITES
jgi:hypothetical protein